MTLVLSRADVARVLQMEDVIEAIERAHSEHAVGRAEQLTRVALRVPDRPDLVLPMAAVIPSMSAGGVKILADFPTNAQRGLPVQTSAFVSIDVQTGECDAILGGKALTAYRTAAASAVATKFLSRPGSSVLGLLGAGTLARMHLEALAIVRQISQVIVWSRTRESAERFTHDVSDRGIAIEIAKTPEEVVRAADIVCTLTPAQRPILHGAWLREGLHINVVGAPPRKDYREVDTEAVVRSRVVVDSRDAIFEESGDLMIPIEEGAIKAEHFRDELGDVINGAKAGRTGDSEITMYKSVGIAIQDAATARLVVDRARRQGLGTEVCL